MKQVVASCALVAWWFSVSAQASDRLVESIRRNSFADAVVPYTLLPKWSGPFLLSWGAELFSGSTQNLVAHNRDGSVAFRTTIWFPDAAKVVLRDAAADKNGHVLAGGFAVKSGGESSDFLASVASSGQVTQAIQTGRFLPEAVAVAEDGGFWTMGTTFSDAISPDATPDSPVLRHYDGAGRLLHQLLPRSTFHAEPSPAASTGWTRAFLFASDEYVGVFSGTGGERIQISLSGTVLGRWKIAPPSPSAVSARPWTVQLGGMALTSSGDVYASFYDMADTAVRLYRLDSRAGRWIPVETRLRDFGPGATFHYIYGADGPSLVVGTSADTAMLHWVRYEKR